MRGDTLVTGGSDGSVRVWSLEKMAPIHRLAAHDNSVTSLQFDETRVVSGGSDGRVKVWDLKTGQLVRELGKPADAVWRVAFEEEKCVVMASRANRTVMEVWSFSPPDDYAAFSTPSRPLSAVEYRSSDGALSGITSGVGTVQKQTAYAEDTVMTEAGPSTAPEGVGSHPGATFFHEDP